MKINEYQSLVGRSIQTIELDSLGCSLQIRAQRMRAAAKLSRASGALAGMVADTEACKSKQYSATEASEAAGRVMFWLSALCQSYGVDLQRAMEQQASELSVK